MVNWKHKNKLLITKNNLTLVLLFAMLSVAVACTTAASLCSCSRLTNSNKNSENTFEMVKVLHGKLFFSGSGHGVYNVNNYMNTYGVVVHEYVVKILSRQLHTQKRESLYGCTHCMLILIIIPVLPLT